MAKKHLQLGNADNHGNNEHAVSFIQEKEVPESEYYLNNTGFNKSCDLSQASADFFPRAPTATEVLCAKNTDGDENKGDCESAWSDWTQPPAQTESSISIPESPAHNPIRTGWMYL